MKKVWIEFHSEEGEIWELFENNPYQKTENDKTSKKNNPAVHIKEMETTDIVTSTIIPAARIVDDVKNQLAKEKKFYLKLELLNGDDWFCMSSKHYTKEEIIKLNSLFVGLTKKQAERVWITKKLGTLNTYRLEKE